MTSSSHNSSHNSSSAESVRDPNVVFLNDNFIPSHLERSDNDSYNRPAYTPRTPSTSGSDYPLLPDGQPRAQRPLSHHNNQNFVSSPLNPNAPTYTSPPTSPFARSRTQSRQSIVFNRVASEESHALASQSPTYQSNRTSMILYRLANEDEQNSIPQPKTPVFHRHSVTSTSGESTFTISYDSKYPAGAHTPRKFIPYPFDPNMHINTPEDDDALHDPSIDAPLPTTSIITLRGFLNIGVLILVIVALLCLFIFYPVWIYITQGN